MHKTLVLQRHIIPRIGIQRRPRSISREKKHFFLLANSAFIVFIIAALILQGVIVNYLNTVNFKLNELSQRQSTLLEERQDLEEQMRALASLDALQAKADELGMLTISEYSYLTDDASAVAHR